MSLLVDVATVLSGLATVVVGGFVWVQLRRDREATIVRQLGAASRASASAFLLRRRLLGWIGRSEDDFERWIRDSQNSHVLAAEQQLAIEEARKALAEVGELSQLAAQGLRNAFILLLEGLHRLDEYTAQSRPLGAEMFDWQRKQLDARTDFLECVQSLEGAAIDSRLLDGVHLLRDKRELDEPFGKLARAMEIEGDVYEQAERLSASRLPADPD